MASTTGLTLFLLLVAQSASCAILPPAGAPNPATAAEPLEFPPERYLGYTFDLTDPYFPLGNIQNMVDKIQTLKRYINLDTQITATDVSGLTYAVPNNVAILPENSGSSASYFYSETSSISTSVETITDAGLDIFGIFSFDVATSDVVKKQFDHSTQYYIFIYKGQKFHTSFSNYENFINNTALEQYLEHLPPWDSTNRNTVTIYKEGFQDGGTHVISGSSNGARFALKVAASTTNNEVNSNFGVDVNAEFTYTEGTGSADAGHKTSDQYRQYQNMRTKEASCIGGDPTLAGKIVGGQIADNATFSAWAASISPTDHSATAFALLPIWVVMKKSSNSAIAARGREVQNAFNYIANLKEHRTSGSLRIYFKTDGCQSVTLRAPYQAGAATVGYLTDFKADPNDKNAPKVITNDEQGPVIYVEGPCSQPSTSETSYNIPFTIVNDGSPHVFQIRTSWVREAIVNINGQTWRYDNFNNQDNLHENINIAANPEIYIPDKNDKPDPR